MTLPYPSGYVEYTFSMYVNHKSPLTCDVDDSRVQKIEISKISPDDTYDPKWRLVITLSEVASIKEVDKIGSELKDYIFNFLGFKLKIKIADIRQAGHGVTPREGEGAQCHMIMPAATCHFAGKTEGRRLDQEETSEIERSI